MNFYLYKYVWILYCIVLYQNVIFVTPCSVLPLPFTSPSPKYSSCFFTDNRNRSDEAAAVENITDIFPKCDQILTNQIYRSIKTTWIYSYQRNIIFICQIRQSGKLLFKSFMKTIVGSQKDMIKFYFVHFLLCGVDPFNWEPGGREPGGGVPPNVAGSSIWRRIKQGGQPPNRQLTPVLPRSWIVPSPDRPPQCLWKTGWAFAFVFLV